MNGLIKNFWAVSASVCFSEIARSKIDFYQRYIGRKVLNALRSGPGKFLVMIGKTESYNGSGQSVSIISEEQ